MSILKYLYAAVLLLFSIVSYSQVVNNSIELSSAISSASAGTTIILADGTWEDTFININKNGTGTQPIVITAETPGQVILSGNSRVYMEGSHITVSGLVFQDPSNLVVSGSFIEPVFESNECDFCKVINNKIDSYNGTESQKTIKFKWVLIDEGINNEIAYNSFIGKYGIGSIINDNRQAGQANYIKIHHNYFADRTPINGVGDDNDQDAIRIGTSTTSLSDSYSEVYDNYFYNFFGEIEIISNKSGQNKYYRNTFRDYAGCLTLRHGDNCEVYNNYFFAENNPFTAGVRVIGEGHKIYNNYIEGINSFKESGSSSNVTGGINVTNGRVDSELSGYFQVKDTEIVNNTFVNCDYALRIGTKVNSDLVLAPENLTLANNIMYNTSLDAHQVITAPTGDSLFEGNQTSLNSNAMQDDGFFHRLTNGSSPIESGVGSYPYLTGDLLEGTRSTNYDAGAEEFGANGTHLPFGNTDVGVSVGFLGTASIGSDCQTQLSADGAGSTYDLITSILAPNHNPIEVPDCSHPGFGDHITEVWDDELQAYVFAFHIHVDEDDDRCINFDRQRNEIKAYDQSPDNLIGTLGETVVYKWKFKLDEDFQASQNFTHLHQIKAVGGDEASIPKVTLTARTGSPDRIELRFSEVSTSVTLESADLDLFRGNWVEVTETITYGEEGYFDISIKNVSDGSLLLAHTNESIRMWNTDAEFMRPKWGIYRSLDNSQQLRDEIVYFNDFCVDETVRLTVSPSVLNFSDLAEAQTFDINTNVAWEITEELGWLTLDVSSGFGPMTITATVQQNETGVERIGTITIDEVAGGNGLSNQVFVTQDFAKAGSGEVIITEIYNRPLKPTQEQLDAALPNNPPGADLTPDEGHCEWFEIYNTTEDPIVMDGWVLTDASSSSRVTVIGSYTIEPLSYAVFSGFNIPEAHGGVEFDFFYDYEEPSFNNESSYSDPGDSNCPDGVIITKPDGTLVDEVRYDYGYGEYLGNSSASASCRDNEAAIGLPPAQGSSKISFMLNVDPSVMNSTANDLAENWSFSTLVYDEVGNQIGTPGLPNDQMVVFDLDNDGYTSDVDCDDSNPNINPDATEVPYNGIDDDCDPLTFDDDLDQDGFVQADDCDDTNSEVNADATEVPYNGIDDDCNEATLDDDLDQDGFVQANDCDDTNSEVNADATEVPYNGIDDDCNESTLDDDLDQDGFVQADDCDDTNSEVNADATEVPYNGIDDDCNASTLDDDLDQDGFVLTDDCDDSNSEVNPDATEIPYNGIDDDCAEFTFDDDLDLDGYGIDVDCDDTNADINPGATDIPANGIDEDCQGGDSTDIEDTDNDGFGTDVDCDDNNPDVNPDQEEVVYNGLDDDCDASTLDDDLDQDGFALAFDCNDDDASINPNAIEVPYNGIDEDCDTSTLDDDLDQDGYVLADDCDDANPTINPGNTEVPYNGVDDDCDASTLDDDLDQDGFVQAEDCDDTNAEVNPDAVEEPYNGVDDDCDPSTLDDDLDQDGFALVDDCDDMNTAINPDAVEEPYNGVDDDCDPSTLDDDLDQDGFALADDCDDMNAAINPDGVEEPYNGIDDDCDPSTLDDDLDQDGFVMVDDCDDTNSEINPDATEEPYNGVDDDCNPITLDDDLDEDGFVLADDCDDDNVEINPNGIEIPNNGIDEDCDGMDLTSSVHDLAQHTISIFPNPIFNVINIEVTGDLQYQATLFDLDGQMLLSATNSSKMNVEVLQSGIYILVIQETDTGLRVVEKLVKD